MQIYRARITKIGNSKGIRIPKELVSTLNCTEVMLEKTDNGILIKPAFEIPPLKEWGKLFSKVDKTDEDDFKDWEVTLNDGLDD
ncbi:MAG: AbrB/MazE/SpoVT family DNA-binding domain-containing protein [Ginsengibacter sp.]